MSNTIKLENTNAVEDLTITIPDGGNIIVILGPNDCGKSKTLDTIDRMCGGNAKIKKRFGSKRGVVEGLGVRLDLMASVRASGECEAVSLTGRLDIGDLIDPGLKSPEAADAVRMKALLTVRGVKADIGLFCPMVNFSVENMKEFASDATLAATNLVDMAARVKNDFEVGARQAADQAKTAEAGARAKREVAEGVDMEAESDIEKLQDRLEVAIRDETTVIQTRANHAAALNKRETAKRNLAEAEAGYEGPTFDDAAKEAARIGNAVAQASDRVTACRKALDGALSEESRLETAYEIAVEKRNTATQHETAMAGWAETIEIAADVEEVSDTDLSEAAVSVEKARQDGENGVRIRDAKKALAEADDLQGDADLHQNVADQLRDAAKGTTDVLAEAVQAGTLVPVTDDNGNFRFAVKSDNGSDRRTYYHDLGPGRRTMIAVTEVASCLRDLDPDAVKIALIVLPQGMWQDLDYNNRCLVWKHVKSLGVNLVAAQCDSDPSATGGIRAEVFEPKA